MSFEENWTSTPNPMPITELGKNKTRTIPVSGNGSFVVPISVGIRYVIRVDGTFGSGSVTVASGMARDDINRDLPNLAGDGDLTFTEPGSVEYVGDGRFLEFTMAGSSNPDVKIYLMWIAP